MRPFTETIPLAEAQARMDIAIKCKADAACYAETLDAKDVAVGQPGLPRVERALLEIRKLGPKAQEEIYQKSSIDLALKDAFRKMRTFLMTTKGMTEDEAISLSSVAVDFGVTQVVDGNWGIHAIIKKSLFAGA